MAQEDDQPTEIAITSSWEERLKILSQAALEETPTEKKSFKPKIQSVPATLRDHRNVKRYFKPRVVAIGPFHHRKPEYKRGEEVKLKLAARFVKDCSDQTNNITAKLLLRKIAENIKELRECYDEEATKEYDDDALTWMLFVDGCWMLEFIYKYINFREPVSVVEQDMFLLDNQLPFLVLTLLMSCSNKCDELKRDIKRFVEMHGVATPTADSGFFSWRGKSKKYGEHAITIEGREPTHLLDLLRTTMLGASSDIQEEEHGNRSPKKIERGGIRQCFRNVEELQEAGIHFRPSKGKSLGNINFKHYLLCIGFLELPRIKVDDSTGLKLMNLIAYEMCPDFQNDFGVTSYISFLDSLIAHPEDVKHLRKKRILHNLLGSDEDVAQFFNEIGTDLEPNNEIYSSVKAEIEDHFQTKWKVWMAQVIHDTGNRYFRSPWSLPASIGGLAVIVMTAIQTWMTVIQTRHTVHSPPSP